eukprot:CAMPEP_0119264824 /NCGR_PEP_ID=MMETSP1329-20130426/3818_1 /TAXON_ID=114041 /ORGANISM="Genus nov. species nov., Strain RCC1024" /LENGTH=345 /DNA_ID=CAMNT_0007264617 /DNA_START=165 /DNA_END=1199 /DNA_ORIENTATION=+
MYRTVSRTALLVLCAIATTDARPVNATPSRPINDTRATVAFFGIPKAASKSFAADVGGIAGPLWAHNSKLPDRCSFRDDQQKTRRTISMFREPVSHVQSMYAHCAEPGSHEFQGRTKGGKRVVPFETWVRAWVNVTTRAGKVPGNQCPSSLAYRPMQCVNPVDTQTYALSCRSPRPKEFQYRRVWTTTTQKQVRGPRKREAPTHAMPYNLCGWLRARNATEAAERLEDQSLVGIVELYAESLCVLAYHQTGSLPTGCRCEDRAKLQTTRHQKRSEPHHVSMIDAETRALVVKHLVSFDLPLYAAARKRLLDQVAWVERKTGESVWCGRAAAEAEAAANAKDRAAE